jgi:hypothetical protein
MDDTEEVLRMVMEDLAGPSMVFQPDSRMDPRRKGHCRHLSLCDPVLHSRSCPATLFSHYALTSFLAQTYPSNWALPHHRRAKEQGPLSEQFHKRFPSR